MGSMNYCLIIQMKRCLQRFNERKQRGLIPKNAKIGGGIAIHATTSGGRMDRR